MARLQATITAEMDRKLTLYSAYLGISKNDYTRQILTFWLREAEQNTIPAEIVKAAEKGDVHEDK